MSGSAFRCCQYQSLELKFICYGSGLQLNGLQLTSCWFHGWLPETGKHTMPLYHIMNRHSAETKAMWRIWQNSATHTHTNTAHEILVDIRKGHKWHWVHVKLPHTHESNAYIMLPRVNDTPSELGSSTSEILAKQWTQKYFTWKKHAHPTEAYFSKTVVLKGKLRLIICVAKKCLRHTGEGAREKGGSFESACMKSAKTKTIVKNL